MYIYIYIYTYIYTYIYVYTSLYACIYEDGGYLAQEVILAERLSGT